LPISAAAHLFPCRLHLTRSPSMSGMEHRACLALGAARVVLHLSGLHWPRFVPRHGHIVRVAHLRLHGHVMADSTRKHTMPAMAAWAMDWRDVYSLPECAAYPTAG